MRSRFVSNMMILVLAGVLVPLSLTLRPAVVTWIALGIGFGVVVVTAGAFLARGRGAVQRGLDAPVALLGGWMMVAARVFAGPTLRWLSFGEAVALGLLALCGLIAHEALRERALRGAWEVVAHDGRQHARRHEPAVSDPESFR